MDVNNIGYRVFTSAFTIGKVSSQKQKIKLYTYMHVKEDILALYGFIGEDELSIFELLISVSGVGPKVALAALSTMPPSEIALAIASNDIKTLTKAPGVGNKIAQRIHLELKDKIKSDYLEKLTLSGDFSGNDNHSSEAINALVALGYSLSEANTAIKKLGDQNMSVEETVKQALKNLAM
jgi:Holliday junction DNA helicase RuvA